MEHEHSAGAIIFRENKEIKYLFLVYEKGYLDFPRGNVERGETELEAAKREVFEETGLKVDFIPGFRAETSWFYRKDGKLVKKTVVYFLAKTDKKEIKVSWEHKGYEWLTFEEAMEKLKFENTK
ncbi:MAG TPA: NUDIX domain-containing protein, partial [Candidatus Aenigmarchaeota archaeon]|nr:NUDIX domain-containing protein [Candidatus Aenigmarchaeota archaeon]